MGISIGRAHKLKWQAAAFTVQPPVNMNATQDGPDGPGATPPAQYSVPLHAKKKPWRTTSWNSHRFCAA